METFSRGTLLEPWFVTGFAEGEGSFTYSRNGRNISLYFSMKLAAADVEILHDIQTYFGGIGRIYIVKPRSPSSGQLSGWTEGARLFRVSKQAELERVLLHFDSFPLRGTKAASYAVWRRMVELKRAFRRPPRQELEVLAGQLSASSSRNAPWN